MTEERVSEAHRGRIEDEVTAAIVTRLEQVLKGHEKEYEKGRRELVNLEHTVRRLEGAIMATEQQIALLKGEELPHTASSRNGPSA